MRTSTEQVRHATVDAVDAAKHRASGLVSTGADLVTSTLDKGASVVEGGIERVADHAPLISVGRPKRRHRVRTTLIAVGVLVVILAVAKKLSGQMEGTSDSEAQPRNEAGQFTSKAADAEDTEHVPAGSG